MPTLKLPDNIYINHSYEIEKLLTQNNISYDLLHGTRSNTLISMYADGVGADIKGALLAKKEAEKRGIKPETGNFKANARSDCIQPEDPVTKGKYVSTALKSNANLAHYYATEPSLNDCSENYPVIFAIQPGNLEIREFKVNIPGYKSKVQTDYAVKKMIPMESISAVLVPKDHTTEAERLGGNIRVFGYNF